MYNLSSENEFHLYENKESFPYQRALNLVLIQRRGGTQKWPIQLCPRVSPLLGAGKRRGPGNEVVKHI